MRALSKNKQTKTNKQTNKQTHVLPSYGRVLYKFNETPLLDQLPLRMSLPLKVSKLNEHTQAKYHDCNTL